MAKTKVDNFDEKRWFLSWSASEQGKGLSYQQYPTGQDSQSSHQHWHWHWNCQKQLAHNPGKIKDKKSRNKNTHKIKTEKKNWIFTYSGKSVASVGDEKASFSNSTISNCNTFDELCSSSISSCSSIITSTSTTIHLINLENKKLLKKNTRFWVSMKFKMEKNSRTLLRKCCSYSILVGQEEGTRKSKTKIL